MPLYKVKLRVEYVVELETESRNATEASKDAMLEAAVRIEKAFLDGSSTSGAAGDVCALEAVCLTELA